jgi:colanic acid biosynthesis glycosyl transferase WcaI
MNILIVSQYYWPESFRINDVTKTLYEKGQQVELISHFESALQNTKESI